MVKFRGQSIVRHIITAFTCVFFINYALILCHYQSIRSYSHNMWYVNFGCTFARVHHTHTHTHRVHWSRFSITFSYLFVKLMKKLNDFITLDVYRDQKFICGSFNLFNYFWIKLVVQNVSLIIKERECYFHFNRVVIVD